MAALLQEEITYDVRVGVTNTSKKAGIPTAAQLRLEVSAEIGGISIGSDVQTENFAAGERKEFLVPITPPAGSGGMTGEINATVKDPDGNQLGSGQLGLVVEESAGSEPFSITPISTDDAVCQYSPAYWIAEIIWRVRNNSTKTVTHQLTCRACRPGVQDENNIISYQWTKYWEGEEGGNPQVWMEVTLGPGQSIDIVSPFYYLDGYANGHDDWCNMPLPYHSGTPIRYAYVVFDEKENWSQKAYVGAYP